MDGAHGPILGQEISDDGEAVRLIEDREVREKIGVTLGFRLDDVVAEAMERPDEHAPPGLAGAQNDALLHLTARQDVGDAAGQRIRLARTSGREQEDVVRQVLHRLALRRIQFCKFHTITSRSANTSRLLDMRPHPHLLSVRLKDDGPCLVRAQDLDALLLIAAQDLFLRMAKGILEAHTENTVARLDSLKECQRARCRGAVVAGLEDRCPHVFARLQ